MLSDSEDDDDFQRSSGDLHNALHLAVGNICRREDTAAAQAPQTSKDAIEALTQMTFHYATKCLAKDLVAFCKHANRKTITGKPRQLNQNYGSVVHSLNSERNKYAAHPVPCCS